MNEKQKMGFQEHPRQILHNFLSLQLCKELEFIQKSNCSVGYRPNVFSTTISHLIATNSLHLIMPFIPLREKMKEKVEEVFGCEYELFVEFTGLISWTKGASIGWHSDDNRPYLRQRDFTAVCYLNSYDEDFKGGIFHFQDGEPKNYVPMAGDLVLYTADRRNIHCVDEITDGERVTLTLWFSRDRSHDEDAKLLSFLSQNITDNGHIPHIPMPASSNMYWLSSGQSSDIQQGFDICFARLFFLGYDIYPSQGKSSFSEMLSFVDISDVFNMPLKLVRGDELFSKEFANLLHALQAVQFYNWKQSVLQHTELTGDTSNVVAILSEAEKEDIYELKQALLRCMQLDEKICSHYSKGKELQFDWTCFCANVTMWESYVSELHTQLLMSLPFWKDDAALCSVSFRVAEKQL